MISNTYQTFIAAPGPVDKKLSSLRHTLSQLPVRDRLAVVRSIVFCIVILALVFALPIYFMITDEKRCPNCSTLNCTLTEASSGLQ
jgi:hypothetical protein